MRLLLLFCLMAASALAEPKVKVVTSLTDLAWAVKQIGGEFVEVTPLLNGTENPHYVDAVPRFISAVADAQVVCLVGLDLEVGWLPKVLVRSGNAAVQPGGKGYCETGTTVNVLEKITGAVNRSMGDVHAQGNPHYWLAPRALAEGAQVILQALSKVDPAHAENYNKNYATLVGRLQELQKKNREKVGAIVSRFKGPVLIEYHKEFSYFTDAYGLTSLGSIEEKPGVPPSAGRIAEIAMAAKKTGVKVALAGPYAPEKILARFTELSGVPVKSLPTSLQPKGSFTDYVELQNHLVDTVLQSLRGPGEK